MHKSDKDILELLKEDSRLTPKDIAAATGLAEDEVKSRMRALEESGVIVRYTAIINADETEEEEIEAMVEVKVTPMRGHGFEALAKEIAVHNEVKDLYLMSGAIDLMVIVRGKSLRTVSRFIAEKISTYDNVIATTTHFILKKYKVEGVDMSEKEGGERMSVQA